jgi:hypothetical protein
MKVWIGAAVVLIACGKDAPTQDTSQPRPRGVCQSQPHNAQPEAPAAAVPQQAQPRPAFPELDQQQAEAAKPKAEAAPVEKKPEERDLNAELLAAVGSPVDCLKPRTGENAPTSLRVQLDATVVETGLVTRAYAHSSQLDAEELQCMTKRVSSLRLSAPIDQAPRSLSATLELTAKTPETPAN